MEELIEVVTSKGDKVYLKPRLTHGQNRLVNHAIASHVTLDPVTRKFNDVTAEIRMFGQEKALELLLSKVLFVNGTIATNPHEAIENFDVPDGGLVMEKVKEIYDR